jgi:hypothetical protein
MNTDHDASASWFFCGLRPKGQGSNKDPILSFLGGGPQNPAIHSTKALGRKMSHGTDQTGKKKENRQNHPKGIEYKHQMN